MDYYDEIAQGYDSLHKEEQLSKLLLMLDLLNVQKTDRVLDVGCGTAFSFDALKLIGCRFQGVEPSKGLIAHSKYKEKITNCKAEEIPFPNKLFTVVLSVTALQNFDDTRKGLLHMKRVCSDRLCISFLKRSQRREEFDALLRELFEITNILEHEKDMIYLLKA